MGKEGMKDGGRIYHEVHSFMKFDGGKKR